jgi:hypothetical protein
MRNTENLEPQAYEKPTVTKLTREQAMLKVMGYAMMGSRTAKELLELLFEAEAGCSERNESKKSA